MAKKQQRKAVPVKRRVAHHEPAPHHEPVADHDDRDEDELEHEHHEDEHEEADMAAKDNPVEIALAELIEHCEKLGMRDNEVVIKARNALWPPDEHDEAGKD